MNQFGICRYRRDDFSIIVIIDKETSEYYYGLIPEYKHAKRQKHPCHITVVRAKPKEIITDFSRWGEYDGRKIKFSYDGIIHFKKPYFYLNVWSDDIAIIRKSLGLKKYRDGFNNYHITIGNVK